MSRDPRLVAFAKTNRHHPTLSESMLWADLRNRQLGFKFRRQQPIGPFIVDFVCLEKKLIVELDGWTHDLEENEAYDRQRHQWLEREGYRILRFNDDDVMQDRTGVVDAIYLTLHTPQVAPPSRSSLRLAPPSPQGRAARNNPPLGGGSNKRNLPKGQTLLWGGVTPGLLDRGGLDGGRDLLEFLETRVAAQGGIEAEPITLPARDHMEVGVEDFLTGGDAVGIEEIDPFSTHG
jgi:very-short-patch-repair endonuclease